MDGFVGTRGFCAFLYGLCLVARSCETQLLFCYASRLESAEITRQSQRPPTFCHTLVLRQRAAYTPCSALRRTFLTDTWQNLRPRQRAAGTRKITPQMSERSVGVHDQANTHRIPQQALQAAHTGGSHSSARCLCQVGLSTNDQLWGTKRTCIKNKKNQADTDHHPVSFPRPGPDILRLHWPANALPERGHHCLSQVLASGLGLPRHASARPLDGHKLR